MKIYTYWPRELTLFDPRFFSVHHFQSGINKIVENGNPVTSSWFIKGVAATDASVAACQAPANPLLTVSTVAALTTGTVYGKYNTDCVPYPVDDSEVPSVDYRVPTYSNNDIVPADSALSTQTDNTIIPTGTILYKNSPVRRITEGRIEPKRRGKLLPFSYYRKFIGVNRFSNLKTGAVTQASLVANSPTLTPKSCIFVIVDAGKGYTSNQRFTTKGGSGTGVSMRAITNPDGSISDFFVDDPGQGFSTTDFLNSTDLLATAKGGVLAFPETAGDGTGFVGFFTNGKVYDVQQTDAGPKKAKGETLISPNTSNGGVISSTITNTIQIEQDNAASDNRYTMFFHFHNDCQHTMFSASDYHSIVPTNQQHITVSLGG